MFLYVDPELKTGKCPQDSSSFLAEAALFTLLSICSSGQSNIKLLRTDRPFSISPGRLCHEPLGFSMRIFPFKFNIFVPIPIAFPATHASISWQRAPSHLGFAGWMEWSRTSSPAGTSAPALTGDNQMVRAPLKREVITQHRLHASLRRRGLGFDYLDSP